MARSDVVQVLERDFVRRDEQNLHAGEEIFDITPDVLETFVL